MMLEETDGNVELFLRMLYTLVRRCKPAAAYLDYEGDRIPWPFNARLAYFSDAAAVMDDLSSIHRGWTSTEYAVWGPLRDIDPRGRYVPVLGKDRTEEERIELKERLAELLPYTEQVRIEDVTAVESSSEFDILRRPEHGGQEGFVVTVYPEIANRFVDKFYLRVLETTRSRLECGTE